MWLVFMGLSWGMELWTIPKLNCMHCEKAMHTIGASIDGFTIETTSKSKNQICFSGDTVAFEKKLQEQKFTVSKKQTVDTCPKIKKNPWSTLPAKVKVVSTGEKFKYKEHLSKGEYTIFDFGASWCGPCYNIDL